MNALQSLPHTAPDTALSTAKWMMFLQTPAGLAVLDAISRYDYDDIEFEELPIDRAQDLLNLLTISRTICQIYDTEPEMMSEFPAQLEQAFRGVIEHTVPFEKPLRLIVAGGSVSDMEDAAMLILMAEKEPGDSIPFEDYLATLKLA